LKPADTYRQRRTPPRPSSRRVKGSKASGLSGSAGPESKPAAGRTPSTTAAKLRRLEALLAPYRRVVLAFSGGVDSTFLLARLCRDPGRRVLAITVLSPVHSRAEREEAREGALRFKVEHREIRTDLLRIGEFQGNPPDRCYHCKRALFSRLQNLREKEGFEVLVDGSNQDDLQDFRPGSRALRELGVRSPLQEAGLGKAEIRSLSRRLRLDTWNKPSMACLASRIPYGSRITREALRRIENCEAFLLERVRGPVRVRTHANMARIELDPKEVARFLKIREATVVFFKSQGFTHISLDLEGYRTGSMNEGLSLPARQGSKPPARSRPPRKGRTAR